MIAENGYLIPNKRKQTFCEPNRYLLIATDVEAEMKEKGDDFDYKLESIYNRINNHADLVSNGLNARLKEIREESKMDL